MPPQFLVDISQIDLGRVIFDQDAIRRINPQRGAMEHLNGIVYVDEANHALVGYKDVRADEFWVAGHIPGPPVLPGVIKLECAAQLTSFYAHKYVGWMGFIGFGGAEDIKFRQQVVPGQRLYMLGKQTSNRHGRLQCGVQGIVEGALVFEGSVTGMLL